MSADLRVPLRVGSMFSGIGGIDLGLERTGGFETVWFAEIDEYASAVLRKHWPDVPNYGDVRNIDAQTERVDVLAAGFPCQPVSLAGKGLAQEDPRWLWPEVARVVGLLRPRYVLLENVPGLRKRGLSIVIGDLATLGYDAEWQIISAASVGAPHLRERFVIVAYPNSDSHGRQGIKKRDCQTETGSEVQQWDDADGLRVDVADASSARRREDARSTHGDEGTNGGRCSQEADEPNCDGEGRRARNLGATDPAVPNVEDADLESGFKWRSPTSIQAEGGRAWPDATGRGVRGIGEWFPEPDVGRVANGVPARMDRLRSLGNAVVPQVAEAVGHLILEHHLGIAEAA